VTGVMTAAPIALPESRAKRLKAATHATHDRLDLKVMDAAPFATREGYARFLRMQWAFHAEIAGLYGDARLQVLLPGLAGRQRLALIGVDLADLGQALPEQAEPPRFPVGAGVSLPEALGWLYVAEGSNIGAALLRKEAAKLGMSDDLGARHLAPGPGGPAAHWRDFTGALDAVALGEPQEERVLAGAQEAFARVHLLVDRHLG
jgi:heme oxygenase (biliverdin-IX-beta and delta-forming)